MPEVLLRWGPVFHSKMKDTLGKNLHINSGFCLSGSDLNWNKGLNVWYQKSTKLGMLTQRKLSQCEISVSERMTRGNRYKYLYHLCFLLCFLLSTLFARPPSFFLCNGPWCWSIFYGQHQHQNWNFKQSLSDVGRNLWQIPCLSFHFHIWVVMIKPNQPISWWWTWTREERFMALLRAAGGH